jgi:hypothetical protein
VSRCRQADHTRSMRLNALTQQPVRAHPAFPITARCAENNDDAGGAWRLHAIVLRHSLRHAKPRAACACAARKKTHAKKTLAFLRFVCYTNLTTQLNLNVFAKHRSKCSDIRRRMADRDTRILRMTALRHALRQRVLSPRFDAHATSPNLPSSQSRYMAGERGAYATRGANGCR